MATIWQYGALRVNDETAMPVELLAPCIAAGYKRVEILLNARRPGLGEVPHTYVDAVKGMGAKAWGVVWADSFTDPQECADFVISERERLVVSGFVMNCEDAVEARDQAGDRWSERFLTAFRQHPTTAKLSLGIDTYNGCGGIALRKWQNRSARLICQTHHEGETHAWPIDGYMTWAKNYGWTRPAMIKPELGVYKPLPNRAEQIAAAQRAGTQGFIAYYAEGAGDPAEHLIPLLREAQAAGVCA